MSKIVRSHNSNANVIKGIGQTNYITGNSFQGIADPLSEDNNYVNKPACSIPSLFARMIFFKMAFEPGNYTNRNNVYDTFVSQCLDLLEMIFNNDPSITIRQFRFTDQINALRNDGISAHWNFAEILAEQQQKYMPNVGSIFLFEQNGKIIGGTSPYTLVYTSPNWNSGKPVTPLIQRNALFQQYLFDLHDVCSNTGQFNPNNNSFFNYIGKVMQNRGLRTNMNIGIANLNNMYSPVTYSDNGNRVPVVVDGTMFLHSGGQFDSDLFVAPTQAGYSFDPQKTPIVLSSNIPAGLIYYNKVRWNPNFTVQNVSDGPLPGNCPPHPNLRIVDFFEDKLFALPYPIDEVKYGRSIEISDGNGNSQYYSALLPLKPTVLTYFKKEDIKDPNFLSIIKNPDGNSITIRLNIPIRNADGTRRNQIQLSKTYNLTTDVEYVFMKGTDNAFNVGISPFVKSNVALNKYCVMMVLDEPSVLKNPELSFYRFGNFEPMVLPQGASAQRSGVGGGRKTWYVTVDDFDFIRVKLTDASGTDFYALIVPDFVDVNNCPNIYGFYGVDFGTTNTHIAYYDYDNQNGETKSFSSIDFQCQVAYLNKLSRSLTGGSVNVVDKFRVLKAREFFPIASDNQYGFPFRTALYSEKATNQDSKVFKEASIGFHYEKEYVPNPSYVTSLKWDLINVGNNTAIGNGNVFFVELMHVVRNHWLNQNVDHNSLPRIMFTYPLNQNTANITQCCESAYSSVFGQAPGTNIRWMTESLAPCQHKIFNGQNVTTGLLNVDIGGGTTDIQYYLENGDTKLSFYDSVLFAGDDLWGQAYENMGPVYAKQNCPDNNFTALARGKFDGNFVINVKGNDSTIASIKLGGKEFVNYLFRDANNSFSNLLSNPNAGADKCRLQMFLHYSAIVFHITNLLKQNGLQVPASISFSGLGSKYLKLLFPVPGYEEQYLKDFTKALINKYYPQANIPTAFSIELRQRPKDATAEGAALSFQKAIAGGQQLTNPQSMTITGFAGNVSMTDITGKDCNKAMESLIEEFLDGFHSVSVDKNLNNRGFIPIMTDDVYEKLKNDCIGSYAQIANGKYNQSTNKKAPLSESAFIWTLKDSIWKI